MNNEKVAKEQPKADSSGKRVNYDNARVDKFQKDTKSDKTERRGKGRKRHNPHRGESKRVPGSCNDVEWYANNPELLKAAASLPFSVTTGARLPWNDSVPGVMAFYYSPTVAGADGDPINQAANSIYSYVVHANSRNYQYSQADQMMLILAGANLFSFVANGIRAYGVMRNYQQQNMYTPEALVRAMGFTYSNLRDNLAQMWFDINEIVARLTQIWIPDVMPVIKRWFWMSTYVYKDAMGVKSQYYLYVPQTLLLLDETGSTQGTQLVPAQSWNPMAETISWGDWKALVNQAISNLLLSEDRGIIFGDILKAYGVEKLYAIKPVSSDYKIEPVYNPEVTTQFENLTRFNFNCGNISQDVNTQRIIQSFGDSSYTATQLQGTMMPSVGVLNFHQDTDPTPQQIMVATRMMCLGLRATTVPGDATKFTIQPYACGTEYCRSIAYFKFAEDATSKAWTLQRFSLDTNNGKSWNRASYTAWTTFDWCPLAYAMDAVGSSAVLPGLVGSLPAGVLADYDNYTTLDWDVLNKMHRTAIYSEFGVPQI